MKKMILLVVGVIFAAGCLASSKSNTVMVTGTTKSCHQKTLKCADKTVENKAVNVGNEICPVMGGSAKGVGVVVEYEGKIYNLCCPACIDTFKADPAKYIAIVEKELGSKSK